MPFSQVDQQKYKTLYLQTAREYVKSLEENLAKLSSGETAELVDTLHRDSHSLKGQSEMMGYHAIGILALLMEDIFRTKKENKLDITPEIINQISAGVKEISVCLDEIEKTDKELDLSETTQKLKGLVPTVGE